MRNPVVHFEHVRTADHLVDRTEAEVGHDLSALFGDHEEVIDQMLRLAAEFLSQLRNLESPRRPDTC